ncbi:type 1 fimbrial protein [Xenorhabdus sp. Reich]|uniref:Type 1 fimbrial protein n=1 Tax=Xenorhabdus littoralis TaxID=2582835 RepID=A0ABU4SHE3_9GAMM|nr:fimbrial protein [Xenorhabdus sp. Reich]MDX7998088.1 type 1 fimbrial protein [Xenorhabdus sp. Reich]
MFIIHKKYPLLLAAISILTGLSASMLSTGSYAKSCHFEPGFTEQKISIASGIFFVNKKINIGEVFGSYPVNTIGAKNYTCDGPEKIEWEFMGYPLTGNSRSDDVHDSGISGVGIRMNAPSGETKVEFVKTKSNTGSGVMTSGVITARLAGTAVYSFYLNEIQFITPSCSLQEENILVPMGKIGSTHFSGINSTAGEQHFDIDLACNTSTPLELVLNSMAPDRADNVLGLDQDNNSADGIGFQVLYQGKPIIFNSPVKLGASTDGIYSIPFTARYIQTENRITAGKATATATLNIIYP